MLGGVVWVCEAGGPPKVKLEVHGKCCVAFMILSSYQFSRQDLSSVLHLLHQCIQSHRVSGYIPVEFNGHWMRCKVFKIRNVPYWMHKYSMWKSRSLAPWKPCALNFHLNLVSISVVLLLPVLQSLLFPGCPTACPSPLWWVRSFSSCISVKKYRKKAM